MTKQSLSYTVLLVGTFLWCLFLIVPPLVASIETPASAVSHRLYGVYSVICHQFDARSLHLFGYKLAVCARCTAIYTGFFIGVLLFPALRKNQPSNVILVLSVAVAPMLIDVALDSLGIHMSTIFLRLTTGSLFGVLIAVVLTPIFQEGLNEIMSLQPHSQGVHNESKA